MSSSPLFPDLSVSLPLAVLRFLLFSLVFFSIFSAVISHPSLSTTLYVSFSPLSVTLSSSLLSVSTAVSLQLCTCSLHYSLFSLLISRVILLYCSVHIHTDFGKLDLSSYSCQKSLISLTFSNSPSLCGPLSSSIHFSPSSKFAASVSVGYISRCSAPLPDL